MQQAIGHTSPSTRPVLEQEEITEGDLTVTVSSREEPGGKPISKSAAQALIDLCDTSRVNAELVATVQQHLIVALMNGRNSVLLGTTWYARLPGSAAGRGHIVVS